MEQKTIDEEQKTAEELLCREVLDDFTERQRRRKKLERQWELNLKFVQGNQYCRITEGGDIAPTDRLYEWEQRRVFNHIAPVIDTRLSKLSRIRPALAVRPASDEENDRRASELASAILSAVQEESDLDGVISSATGRQKTRRNGKRRKRKRGRRKRRCGVAFRNLPFLPGRGKP